MASIIKVMGGNLAANLLALISITLVARFTNPYDMGLWNLAMLVIVYAPVLQFGVINGLNRELPYLIGAGATAEALRMARVTYAWTWTLSLLTAVATCVIAAWFWYGGQKTNLYTSLAIGFIVICTWPTMYLTTTYRTSSEFGRLARNSTVVAFLGVVLTGFVWLFGYVGILLRASVLALFGVAALFHKRPFPVSPKWRKSEFLQLLRVGFPILILGQLDTVFLTFDRLVLADSPANMGYFTIALQVKTFAGIIPAAVSVVLYPRMAQKYGENHKAMDLWHIGYKGALAVTALSAVVGLLGWLLLPTFVRILVPQYWPGIGAAQWAGFTGLALGLAVFNNIFNVIKRQDVFLVGLAFGVLTFWGAWSMLTKVLLQPPLVSAVQAMLVASFVMSTAAAISSYLICRRHDVALYNNKGVL